MTTSALKNAISDALDKIDDKPFLEALYTIINGRAGIPELSSSQKQALDQRKKAYKSGEVKVLTVNEVRKRITKKLGK